MHARIPPITSAERRLLILRGLWPRSIGADKPLMRGTREALLETCPSLDEDELAAALVLQTSSRRYLAAAATPGAWRVNPAGAPVEPVSDHDRLYSAQRLLQLDNEELSERLDDQSRQIADLRGLIHRLEGEFSDRFD